MVKTNYEGMYSEDICLQTLFLLFKCWKLKQKNSLFYQQTVLWLAY